MDKIFKAIIFMIIGSLYLSCGAQAPSFVIEAATNDGLSADALTSVLGREDLLLNHILPQILPNEKDGCDFVSAGSRLARLKLVCKRFNQLITLKAMNTILDSAEIKPEQIPLVKKIENPLAMNLELIVNEKMEHIQHKKELQKKHVLPKMVIGGSFGLLAIMALLAGLFLNVNKC